MSGLLHELLNTSGVFFFAWIIPYGVGLLILAVMYFKFLWRLPAVTRNLLFVAGFVYVFGTIGFEMLGGYHADRYGLDTVLYSVFYTIEESLEMVGVSILLYALLSYITNKFDHFTLTIRPQPYSRNNVHEQVNI